MRSRLDEQEALFVRVQKSTCAKEMPTVSIMFGLAEWENKLNVSKLMHCICFLQKQGHTHTHARTQNVRWYSICVAWLVLLGVLFGSANTELIPKSQLFYSKSHKQLWRVSMFELTQTMPPVHPSVNTYPTKWYQLIRDKTLFHKMYNNLLFIDDFFLN